MLLVSSSLVVVTGKGNESCAKESFTRERCGLINGWYTQHSSGSKPAITYSEYLFVLYSCTRGTPCERQSCKPRKVDVPFFICSLLAAYPVIRYCLNKKNDFSRLSGPFSSTLNIWVVLALSAHLVAPVAVDVNANNSNTSSGVLPILRTTSSSVPTTLIVGNNGSLASNYDNIWSLRGP